jgi:hypothetical protein
MILKIFKDVIESAQSLTETDIQICSYLLHSTAKLTYHNRKNQEYLIKKKGYEYIKGVIATSQDLMLLQGAICTFSNLCETSISPIAPYKSLRRRQTCPLGRWKPSYHSTENKNRHEQRQKVPYRQNQENIDV